MDEETKKAQIKFNEIFEDLKSGKIKPSFTVEEVMNDPDMKRAVEDAIKELKDTKFVDRLGKQNSKRSTQ